MKAAIRFRKDIPFFHDKSDIEFKQDPYENYDPYVIRQSMIHLSDHIWEKHPMQKVLDYVLQNVPSEKATNILEIGCGVGRCIGDIAAKYTESNCWGIDYSYQMLKKAKETWVDGKSTEINLSKYGFSNNCKIESHKVSNLKLGLAKCENLPFENGSQDLVFSSFLLDRLSDPIQGLKEMKRVLHPNGKIVIISPLNFNHSFHWTKFYPPIKLFSILQEMGFTILDWKEDMIIEETMDARGNVVKWNCVGMVIC